MRYAIGILLLLGLGAGCEFMAGDAQLDPGRSDESIVVFLTGNELGWLKPCGCSGGQLGGLNRRAAVLGSVPDARRLIIETGELIPEVSEQMLIKFDVFFQAFQILDYDLVNLTTRDQEVVQHLGILTEVEGQLSLCAGKAVPGLDLPDSFSRTFSVNGRELEVCVKSVDRQAFDATAVRSLFSDANPENLVKILLISECDEAFARSLAGKPLPVDCVVCPIDLEEPEVLSKPGDPCLLISVGQKGRYVGKLVLTLDASDQRPRLSYDKVPVSEDLPYNDDMTELYTTYKEIVKASKLLEKFRKVPLPDGLTYVGSTQCKTCHKEAYGMWQEKKHAHAYATLERVGSQYDPECVACHVVGLEYESGFETEEKTAILKDVGCEVCHGPGSEHVKTWGQAETVDPKKSCLDCHTPEHSAGYAGHEQEFLEKIRHWGEP